MAARKTKSLSEAWREKIKTSMLINRLQDHVNGTVELTASQVTAALGLLKKTAPDLSSVDHSGEVNHSFVARIPSPAKDMTTWEQEYGEPLRISNSPNVQ